MKIQKSSAIVTKEWKCEWDWERKWDEIMCKKDEKWRWKIDFYH